jgi:hypothetical protein
MAVFNLHPVPEVGSEIEITWLPDTRQGNTNAYIGSTGIVHEVFSDGSFNLKLGTGAWLIVGTKYRFRLIK